MYGPERQPVANSPPRVSELVAADCQCFLLSNNASAEDRLAAVFAFLSTRFSFNDFPDFFDMAWRGDLSDMKEPLDSGAWVVPMPRRYSCRGFPGGLR